MLTFEMVLNMEQLSHKKLLIAYKDAIRLNLDKEFVEMIEQEIGRRLKRIEREKDIGK